MTDAWKYIIGKKGTVPLANYPYVSGSLGVDKACKPPSVT